MSNIQLPFHPLILLLHIYPREMKMCVYKKDLSTNLCSSFIHHGFKLELFHISINRMDKQMVVHPHNGLLSNKKARTTDTCYTGINLKNMLNKKNLTQTNTVCVIPTI